MPATGIPVAKRHLQVKNYFKTNNKKKKKRKASDWEISG